MLSSIFWAQLRTIGEMDAHDVFTVTFIFEKQ